MVLLDSVSGSPIKDRTPQDGSCINYKDSTGFPELEGDLEEGGLTGAPTIMKEQLGLEGHGGKKS